jgi:hypothetical protein
MMTAGSLTPLIDAISSSEWPRTSFSSRGSASKGRTRCEYYGHYAATEQWAFAAGVVDGRAAMLVYDRKISLETPAYFVGLDLERDRVIAIHDFLFARYAMEGIASYPLERPSRKFAH